MSADVKPTLVFSLVILVISLTGCAREKNCSAFRTGSFYHPLDGGDTAFVQRDDSSQVEVRPGRIIRLRVNWMNECEYELRTIAVSEHGQAVTVSDSVKDMRVSVKIIETAKDYYIFNAIRTDGLTFSDTLWMGRKVTGAFRSVNEVFHQQ